MRATQAPPIAARSSARRRRTGNHAHAPVRRAADLVWEAMTKPEHVRRWWGMSRRALLGASCEIDLRVGGTWRFVGRGPDGDFPAFFGDYLEIDRPGRLVYTEIFEPFPDADSVVTQRLDRGGRARRGSPSPPATSRETRDIVTRHGMEKGAAISYDRLEDVVAALPR